MSSDPELTPEMRAQMESYMAMVNPQQGISAAVIPGQGVEKQPALPENTLIVGSSKRGLLEFKNTDGQLMTLQIINQETGK